MEDINSNFTSFKSKRRDSTCLVLPKLTEMTQAIIDNKIDNVKYLIFKQEFIDFIDLKGRSYLHLAAYFGTTEIANLLIKVGINVDIRDNEWLTPLHISCFLNKYQITELLLKFGADANSRDRNWVTPLHYCAANNSKECFNILVDNHLICVDLKDKNGASALHYSAYFNTHQITSLLLKQGASCNIKDNKKRTCLHYAVLHETPHVLSLLLTLNLSVDEKDKDGLTALHIACNNGKFKSILKLIEFGSNVNEIDLNNNTPLHYACSFGSVEIIQYLIKAGSNIFSVNKQGLTPFHFTINNYEVDALNYFLINHKNIDINCKDLNGKTALHFAVNSNNLKKIELLIKYNADINVRDNFGRTPLHLAVLGNFNEIIEKFLEINEESVNSLDSNKLSPLHYAAMSSDEVTWKILRNKHSNYNLKDSNGRTVHFYAAINLDFLISILPLPNFLDNFEKSLLHYAALAKKTDSLEYLLNNENYNFDINKKDIFGRTCLHYAATNDSYGSSVKLLLNKNAIANLSDCEGLYPINYSIIYDKVENLEELLKIPETYNNLICPTHCASYYGSLNCLKFLLEKNVFSDLIKSLEYATFSGHLGCVQTLLYYITKNKQLDQLFKSKALYIAVLKSHKDCFDSIMVNLERNDFRDIKGCTPLMVALANNKEKNFCNILESIFDKNCLDTFNRNILFYCVYYNNVEKVKQYLSILENPLQKCLSGQTPLHLAAKLDYFDIVEIILKYLKSKNFSSIYEVLLDNDFYNPLHWACYKGNFKTVKVLLSYTNSKSYLQNTKNNVTPLHLACFSGVYDCIELILNFFDKSITSISDNKNQNAFHYLFMSKSPENIKNIDLLIKHNVDLNFKDVLNRTPFLIAIKNQHFNYCHALIHYNIDLTCQDFNGNNCLHYACHFKAEDIGIEIILKNSDLVNVQNKFNRTALHICASNGLFNLTKELLSANACYNIQDLNGFTPSLSCAKNDNVADCLQLLIDIMLFDRRQSYSNSIEVDKDCIKCSSPIRDERKSFLLSKTIRKSSTLFTKSNDSSALSVIKDSSDLE